MVSESVDAALRRKRSPLRRLGCSILLVFWFALLLTPCFLLVLAANQEIRLSQGELPGQELRIWLIMEAEQRGLGLSGTSTTYSGDNAVCMTTSMNFVLWAGREDPLSYCECFVRSGPEAAWTPTEMLPDACPAE